MLREQLGRGGWVLAWLMVMNVLLYAEEPMIVAHRGASVDAPANTVAAFRLAWQQGADAIEGDFHLTRDGHIVCLHDADTASVAGVKRVVKDSTLAELQALDVGGAHGEAYRGTRIPTLAEVLATVPAGKQVYLEIKCGVEILAPLLAAVRGAGLEDARVVVICFDPAVIASLKKLAPQYRAYWLCSVERDLLGRFSPSLDLALAILKDCGADGFSANKTAVNEAYVKGILAAGYSYHVWTVDDPATARRFADWGAASITTNVPGIMRPHFPGPAD